MEILSVHVQIMNMSKVFSKIFKMLMLETVVLFYIMLFLLFLQLPLPTCSVCWLKCLGCCTRILYIESLTVAKYS